MKNSKTSLYVITADTSQETESSVGHVRYNRMRSEYTLYDNGRNPDMKHGALHGNKCTQELAAVLYETNMLGLRKLQKMSVAIPSIDMDLKRIPVYIHTNAGSLLNRLHNNKLGNLIELKTKAPTLNKDTGYMSLTSMEGS
ncbi:hypothetical protein MHYP_G00292020 [Metynnis hypsauchen]